MTRPGSAKMVRVSQPQRALSDVAKRLHAARKEWRWSLDDLAGEVAKVRAMRGLDPRPTDSLRRQIVDFEAGRCLPRHQWRTLLADALQQNYDALFGAIIDTPLPRPLLLDTAVSTDVIAVIDAQRNAHIQVEHLFGPAYAHDFIDRDLSTIEHLIKTTPAHLRSEIRQAAGRIAEVAGWIAQDSGDRTNAERFTRRAEDYLRAAGPELRALVLMRRSNIVMPDDPDLAVELATDAMSGGSPPASPANKPWRLKPRATRRCLSATPLTPSIWPMSSRYAMTTPSTPPAPTWPPRSRPATCISGSPTMR
jgi:hypothetical protein